MTRKPFLRPLLCTLVALACAAAVWCAVCLGETGHYTDKLWQHRTLSVEKWMERPDLYPHAEVDICLRPDGTFDVTHDEEVTYGLPLDTLLAHYAERLARVPRHQASPSALPAQRLWLDIKIISPPIAQNACCHLDSLCRRYGVQREALIVENDNAESLAAFTRAGFFTSFYVRPHYRRHVTDAQADSVVRQLRRVADSGKVRALSFHISWYATLRHALHRSIPLLTWDHHTSQFLFLLNPMKRPLLHDPQVQVVLLKRRSKFDR